MNPLTCNQTGQPGSASVASIKTASLKKQSLALNVTGLAEPLEVSLNCRTGSEPVGGSLNVRSATAVNSGSTVASVQATTTPWFEQTIDDFGEQAREAVAEVDWYVGRLDAASCNRQLVAEIEASALQQVERLQKRVVQYFSEHGSDSWQSCMDWLIRLTPEDIGCRELLNLLPVELIESRPDLPRQMADQAQTIDRLAAQARLCLNNSTEASIEMYRETTINCNPLLGTYLKSTSTLRYCFLQVALERAPLEKVEALLRHWLHDHTCKDIAGSLTAAPVHPTLITREEPLLQDLLTLAATRLLQPTTQSPVGALLPEADDRLLQAMAKSDHKISFGRTVGAIGAGGAGRNLYLKCRRLNEQESDFMAEPVMLSWLDSAALQLDSATLKPHGMTTFGTLQSLFEELNLSAKQKNDLTRTIVYNKKGLLDSYALDRLLPEHTPGGALAWQELGRRPENRKSPYYDPSIMKTEQQLADFLLNLPFPEKNRAAFVDDLLPALDTTLRAHIVHKRSATLSDEQHWQLLCATLLEEELQSPVTAYLFSTPAQAHYHRYVTDSDLYSETSEALTERPQIQALRAYLCDYGRLFQHGVLGPAPCNLFHRASYGGGIDYQSLYTSSKPMRPGRVYNFDGDASDHPNIGPVPMTLRDGGDACYITPVGWRQSMQSNLTAPPLHWPGTVEKKEAVIESLASAWLGTVLLLGRTLRASTEHDPEGWFNSRDSKKEEQLADLLGDMVVDLFSHSFGVERSALHARLYERGGSQLFERCAREMQAWMSDAFIDHLLAKTVPEELYPDYTGQRENVLIPDDATALIRYEREHPGLASTKHHLGVSYAATPLQGIEILTIKALAESALLAAQRPSERI